ncbi:hypothetical protein CCYA_CCYA08G2251 [Cyanidiococcus yangmingshanensis]|nr:hypothetical protein CCYA_CCYA08G2251 [Cyanidiococcus yangmingshanensis]
MFVLSLTGATLLVRHGETDWNRSGRSQGQLDESRLTARGYEQAQRTAQWLCSSAADQIHTIAVSTLQRARESAYHIEKEDASASKWRRWYTELLWEVHVPWQGEQKLDLDLRYPEAYHRYRQEPDRCPHLAELYSRVEQFWTVRNASCARDTFWVVVAHQQTIRALLNTSTGLPRRFHRLWRIANGGCSLIDNAQRIHLVNGPDGIEHIPDQRDVELVCVSIETADGTAQTERGEHGQTRIRGTPTTLQRYVTLYAPGLPCDKFVWYPGGRSCFRASRDQKEPGVVWFHNLSCSDECWPLGRYLEACQSGASLTV